MKIFYFPATFECLSIYQRLIIAILHVIPVMSFQILIGSATGYTTDETCENSPKERAR